MKVLAVYGSNYGQAEAVLRRVAAVLEARGHAVSVHKGDALPADLAVDGYDAVLVAASILLGRYQAYIRAFVKRHAAALRSRPSAFISVNGTAPESLPAWRAEAEGYLRTFLEQAAWKPRWTATFAGALRYPRYDPITRWVMTMISRSRKGPTDTLREYEFTDWAAVDRFAEGLADDLAGEAAPG